MKNDKQKNTIQPLSPAEMKVLKLIVHDIKSEDIAQKLGLSVHTINNHRKSIIKKTNSNSVIGAITYALKNKLIDVKSVAE